MRFALAFSAPVFHHGFALGSSGEPGFVLCPDLSIHVIDLPKFLGEIEESKDDLERWCYFLRFGEALETDPLANGLNTLPMRKVVEVRSPVELGGTPGITFWTRFSDIRCPRFILST